MKPLRPLIDIDGLVYRTGFAAAENEPLDFTLHTCKKVLKGITDEFSEEPMLVISGKTNFRDTYCKVLPLVGPKSKDGSPWKYKGNRIGAPKPPAYDDIREYFISYCGAFVTEGVEADDMIASESFTNPGKCSICSQDKDFKTIPGNHYNWVKKKHFQVTREQSDLFLLWQIICGDRVDHIPGLKNYGEKKATEIIRDNNRDISKIKKVIADLYLKQYGDVWREVLDETATLLFLQREPGKTYMDYIGGF